MARKKLNPALTLDDISSGEPMVHFVVTVEVWGDEYEVERYSLSANRWNAMTDQERINYHAAQEEQIRDHMNIYTSKEE